MPFKILMAKKKEKRNKHAETFKFPPVVVHCSYPNYIVILLLKDFIF